MIQCIDILEDIHKKYVIHRDIKPQNIMLKNGMLYFIDFGFSTFYIDSYGEHAILQNNHENIIGTPKYVSINIHNGITPFRRDDLISLGYMYLFLLCRELPWDNLYKNENYENYEEIHILHYKNQQRKSLKSIEIMEKLFSEKYPSIFNYIKYCYSID